MKIDRMELDECRIPQAIADGLLKQVATVPIPVPIEDIARAVDIKDFQALETDGFEGGLIMYDDRREGVILFNKYSAPQRRRFTIAHELGHFLNPWHHPSQGDGFRCTKRDMAILKANPKDTPAKMEKEANEFAAFILMPHAIFLRDLRQRKGTDLEHIVSLARRYQISKEATARRYVELNEEPCAIIISRNGKVLRVYRGPQFPFTEIAPSQPLPPQSLSATLDLPVSQISDLREIDGALWLPTQPGRRVPTIYEQVLSQRDGYRMTLLTVETADEDEQSDDKIEESWTPRFHKKR